MPLTFCLYGRKLVYTPNRRTKEWNSLKYRRRLRCWVHNDSLDYFHSLLTCLTASSLFPSTPLVPDDIRDTFSKENLDSCHCSVWRLQQSPPLDAGGVLSHFSHVQLLPARLLCSWDQAGVGCHASFRDLPDPGMELWLLPLLCYSRKGIYSL